MKSTPRPRRHPTVFETVCGLNAALAVFARRPTDITRIAYSADHRIALTDLLRFAARAGVPARESNDSELARLAQTVHHEGVCVVAHARPRTDLATLAKAFGTKGDASILALDGIENPHNVGAIVRSAAYFGATALLVGAGHERPVLTSAAVRVAEGGVEWVDVIEVHPLAPALERLRSEGAHVVGADARADRSLWDVSLPRPCVVVLGSERSGISPAVRAVCHSLVSIPGSGRLDSLNVSVAAGVLLAELQRTGRGSRSAARERP